MKLRQTTAFLFTAVMAVCLTGCSSSSSSATHLLYVSTGQGIYAFRLDSSGRSTSVFTTPFVVGAGPAGMVIHPSGKLAYVANQIDNTISLLQIDTVTATLTEVLPRTQAEFSPHDLVMDSSGSTLYVANQLSNDISVFSANSSGALSLQASLPVGSQPTSMVLANGLLFVGVPNFSSVYVFSVGSNTLTPVHGSPFLVSAGVGSVAVDAATKFLYVTNPATNTVSGFTIQFSSSTNSMVLSAIPGSPFTPTVSSGTTPVNPIGLIMDSTATHLYVTNSGSGSVSQFSIGPNGVLTSLNPATVTVGTNPQQIVFDPFSKLLLVSNTGSNNISQLPVNSDATLGTGTNTITVPTVPQALAFVR